MPKRRSKGARAAATKAAHAVAKELSGKQWVSRFPGSKETADLIEPFRGGVDRFIAAMKAASASVAIGATLRPRERMYLMHWSWQISKGGVVPAAVPPMDGVGIRWDHGDVKASLAAADLMVVAYALKAKPSLNSLHEHGRAIDMTIAWKGELAVRLKDGSPVVIVSEPRTGMNADLIKVGKTYGVIKATFGGDPPHWSDNGS